MKVLRKAFKQELDPSLTRFVGSIAADKSLIAADIKGSKAHAGMLAGAGIITKAEAEIITEALSELAEQYEKSELELLADFEDVHMNVEKQLEAKVGELAGKLHTARSRNDQVAIDTRLYTAEKTEELVHCISVLQLALLSGAEQNLDCIMPGYTHLQRAQPVLFAHCLHAFAEMLERDKNRFKDSLKRTKVSPLGAAALAGTSIAIEPYLSANLAGFSKVFANSIDAVSDRDFALEFLSASSICSVHLSQLAETMLIWASSEFSFLKFSDSVTTASSLMPNKKNPDPLELVRGKSGAVIGDLVNLLVTLKALPLGYNRDLQEVKPAIINSAQILSDCLNALTLVLESMQVQKDTMHAAAQDTMLAATDLAEYLVKKGVPFRQAHEAVSELVAYAREKNACSLEVLALAEYKQFSSHFSDDVFALFNPASSVQAKVSHGSTKPELVEAALSRMKIRIKTEELI